MACPQDTPRSHLSRSTMPRRVQWSTPPQQQSYSPGRQSHSPASRSPSPVRYPKYACPPSPSVLPPLSLRSRSPSPPRSRTPSPFRSMTPSSSPPCYRTPPPIELGWQTPPELQPRVPSQCAPLREFSPLPFTPPTRTPSPCPSSPSVLPSLSLRPRSPSPPRSMTPSSSPPRYRTPPPIELGWQTPPELRPRVPSQCAPLREFSPLPSTPPPRTPSPCPPSPVYTPGSMLGHFHNLDQSDELVDFETEQMMHPDYYSHFYGYGIESCKSPNVRKVPMERMPKRWDKEKQKFYHPLTPIKRGDIPFPAEDPKLTQDDIDRFLYPEKFDWVSEALEDPPYPIEHRADHNVRFSIRDANPTLSPVREIGMKPGSGRYVPDPRIAMFSHSAEQIINITQARLAEEFEKIFGEKLQDVLDQEHPTDTVRERILKKLEKDKREPWSLYTEWEGLMHRPHGKCQPQ